MHWQAGSIIRPRPHCLSVGSCARLPANYPVGDVVVCSAGCLCSFQPRQPFHLIASCELQVGHAAAKVLQAEAGRRRWCTCCGRVPVRDAGHHTLHHAVQYSMRGTAACNIDRAVHDTAACTQPAEVHGTYLRCLALAARRVAGQPEGVSRLGCRGARVEEQQVAGAARGKSGASGGQPEVESTARATIRLGAAAC